MSRIFISVGEQACKCPCWICRSVLSADFHTRCVKQLSPLTSNDSLCPAPISVTPGRTLLPAYFVPTASHSDLQGQRLWIRTRIFTIQPWIWNICARHLSTPSSGAFSNCVYPQSFKQRRKLAQNTLPSLPRMRPSGHQFSVCIRVSARIQRHCKHGGVTGGVSGIRIVSPFL